MIIKSKEQIAQMSSLSVEQKKELCTYLGRAQGRNKDYVIECDGDDAAALMNWWQQHQQKAAKRASKRRERSGRSERQQTTLAEQCQEVIIDLATVKDCSVKSAIAYLKDWISDARQSATLKAEAEARKAAEKVKAFRDEHADIIAHYEALQAEQSRLETRSGKLSQRVSVRSTKREQKSSEKKQSFEKFELY